MMVDERGDKPRRTRAHFTCRLDPVLRMRLDDMRWRLRLPSRQAAVDRAIKEWLIRHDDDTAVQAS
jgi:hypothetical protein